jgi:signal transduction histidine kinase
MPDLVTPDPTSPPRSAVVAVEALSQAVEAIAGVLDVEVVLQLIVDRVRDLVGARYAALGIVDDGGAIERFITSGITPEERARLGPPPRGHGLLGLIIREARPIRIPEISAHPASHGFPPNHPPMHSLLGVPVTVRSRAIGNLYVTDKRDAPEFDAHDERLVELFALHAGIAIENARLYGAVQRLAVVEERDRIGRDLHDGIIQSMYAVSLSLEDVPELMTEDPAEATARVDRAIDALHGTIRDLRNFVFGLRAERVEDTQLVGLIGSLVDQLRQHTVIDVELDAPETPVDLPVHARAELIQIVREAMSNVARHADASRLDVSIREQAGDVVVDIADNGRGFDPAEAATDGHYGLGNMRARATALGGVLLVESRPGSGTRIIVRVPLTGHGRGPVPEDPA